MVKRTKYESNNFDIDSDLDLPDFNFETEEINNDRNPVSTAAKATLRGAAEAVLNPSVIRTTIKNSMPKAYGEGLDLVDHAADSVRSLYDTAAKEFKPVAKDLKRIAGKIAPSTEGVLPKKITEALKKWSKTDGSVGIDLSAERQRSDAMLLELGNIFQAQAESEDKRAASDEAQERFRDGLEQIRHRDQIGQLNSIRVGVDKLANYQDNVLAGYQKKSLELQFRQYFATADLLEVTKKASADADSKLQGILKNTALPEFVKINESERFSELARNKFYSDIRDSLFGDDGGIEYIKKFVGNIRKSLTEKIQNLAQSASQVTFAADMLSDSTGDVGMSKAQLAGGIAGNIAGNYAVERGQKWLKRRLENNPAVAKGAENLSYRINNSGQVINDYFNDTETNWGAFEGLRDFLNENRPGVAPVTSLDADSISEMHKPTLFSKATNKSIIEIIPGYLARIQRELQIIRTGDESVGLSTYDFESNKFTTQRELGRKVVNSIAGKEEREQLKERQNSVLSMIDPLGKFSEEQRKMVSDKLLRISIRKNSTDARHMTDNFNWRGKGGDQVSQAFKDFFEADENGRRGSSLNAIRNQNRFSNAVRGLTEGFNDPRSRLQELINTGQYDVLRNAGLVDENNNISIDNLAKFISGEDLNNATDDVDFGSTGKKRFKSVKTKQAKIYNKTISKIESSASISSEQISSITQAIDGLRDVFKTPPTLKPVETLVELVTSIDKRLADGLMVYGGSGQRSDRSSDQSSWISQQVEGAKKKWSEISLGELGQRAKTLGVKGIGYLRDQASRLKTMAFAAGSHAKDVIQAGLQKAADKMGDVYVGAEVEPRLTRVKMLAGEYIDQATGKVLTSLDDIKGTVVDKAGNVILSLEDLKTAQLRGKIVEYLKDKIQGLGSLLAKGSVYAGGLIGGIYGHGITLGIMGFHAIKKMLPPYDVYIADSMELPVLYASQFKLGAYFSQKTGRVLKHPRDIDGPVLDKDGNILVSEEQIKKGLVDRYGIEVSNVLGRGLNKLKELGLSGFSLIKKFGMSVKNFATGAFGAMGELVKGLFNGFSYFGEKYVEINKDQLDVQLEILKLLQDRLPKRIKGDIDGDGDREGSVEDIIRRRQEEKNRKGELAEKARSTAAGGPGVFGAIANLFKNKKKDENDDDDESSLLSDTADVADIYDSVKGDGADKKQKKKKTAVKKTPKATTKLGRLAQLAKGAGSRAIGAVGRVGAMTAATAASFFGLGGVLGKAAGVLGKAAIGAGSVLGRVGMGAGRLGLAALTHGGTLNVARMAVMGLTGALFSPVGLAALGLTAAYYGYKYLTRRKLEVLNKVRYVQYGFNAADNDHFNAVFELEDKLEPLVKLEGGKASLDEKKADLNELMEPFGVKAEDKEGVRRWSYWFNERFKPIFLAHKSALTVINPKLKIADVDGSKLSSEEKLRYLNATELSGANYDLYTSPFKDHERLESDSRAVQSQIEIARTTIEKEIKDKISGKKAAAGVAVGLAIGKDAVSANNSIDSAKKAAESAAGLTALVSELNKPATSIDSGTKIRAQSNISADYLFTGEKGQMDALTVVRYKTYGLSTMEADKVKALRYLEVYVSRNTSFTKDGASYAQDVETLLEDVKVHFGISGARSPKGYRWISWFNTRFLPVFLNFATAIERATKKSDVVQGERNLTPEQSVAVASAIYSTTTVYEGKKVPVWNVVDVSPWDNYPLNENEQSIELNLEALKEAAKAVIRGEHKADKIRQKTADNRSDAVKAKTVPNNHVLAETGKGAAITYRKPAGLTERQTAESTIYGNNQPEFMRADGKNVRAVGEFMTGVPVKHPGTGTGGDINSLPDVGKGKGWEAVKPLLLSVAKMTGVDPKVLASIAAIESGFDPEARPFNPRTGKYLSSAVGLNQFINDTWNEQMRTHAAKYGIALGTPPTDARANALLGAEFIKSNMNYLKTRVKRSLTATDVYLAHFLGPAGAAKFLQLDPSTLAASVMPKEAEANPGVFFDRTGRARTVGEIYKHFTDKLEKQGKALGVRDSDFGVGTQVATQADTAQASKVSDSGASLTTSNKATGVNGKDSNGAADDASKKTSIAVIKPVNQNKATAAVVAAMEGPAKTSVASLGNNPAMLDNAVSSNTAKTTTSTVQPTEQSSVVPRSPVRTPNGFGGYQPQIRPSAREIKALDEANRPVLAEGIDSVNRTLLKSLGVHEASHALLQQLVEAVKTMPMKSDAKVEPSKSRVTPVSTPQAPPTPAVSMGRSN